MLRVDVGRRPEDFQRRKGVFGASVTGASASRQLTARVACKVVNAHHVSRRLLIPWRKGPVEHLLKVPCSTAWLQSVTCGYVNDGRKCGPAPSGLNSAPEIDFVLGSPTGIGMTFVYPRPSAARLSGGEHRKTGGITPTASGGCGLFTCIYASSKSPDQSLLRLPRRSATPA